MVNPHSLIRHFIQTSEISSQVALFCGSKSTLCKCLIFNLEENMNMYPGTVIFVKAMMQECKLEVTQDTQVYTSAQYTLCKVRGTTGVCVGGVMAQLVSNWVLVYENELKRGHTSMLTHTHTHLSRCFLADPSVNWSTEVPPSAHSTAWAFVVDSLNSVSRCLKRASHAYMKVGIVTSTELFQDLMILLYR